MAGIREAQAGQATTKRGSTKLPFYRVLWGQVLLAMLAAVALGYWRPERAVAMKPLGDAFIRLITMIITLIIFCTVVTGIAGMGNLKKVGRVGSMALLYFEVVSTLALLIGLLVGNVVHPGSVTCGAPERQTRPEVRRDGSPKAAHRNELVESRHSQATSTVKAWNL